MKQTITCSMFHDAFIDHGRGDNFSPNGLTALFNYLEELEADTGNEMELDIIALCCDFSEYATAMEAAKEYTNDEIETEEDALDYLRDNTTVIEYKGGIIVQSF